MKKLLLILLLSTQIQVTTVYEDDSSTKESLLSHVVYKYIKVPLSRIIR